MALKNCCSDGYTHTSSVLPCWCFGMFSTGAIGILDFSRCIDKLLLLLLRPVVGAFGTTSMLMRAECSAAPAVDVAAALLAYEQLACPVRMLSELHPAAGLVALLLLVLTLLLPGCDTGHPANTAEPMGRLSHEGT